MSLSLVLDGTSEVTDVQWEYVPGETATSAIDNSPMYMCK